MNCITSSTCRGKGSSNRASVESIIFGSNTLAEFASGSMIFCMEKNGVATHILKTSISNITFTVENMYRFESNSFLP